MNKKVFLIIPLVIIVGVGLYFIFKKPITTPTTEDNSNETPVVDENDTTPDTTPTTPTTESDFTGFSTSNQVIGVVSDGLFTLDSITDTSHTGYHSFKFNLSTTSTSEPFVTAKYLTDTGVIRVELNQVEDDNSGIGYQKERSINKEGIVRLYHAVTSVTHKEIYEIGLSKSTTFKLYLVDGNVILDVKYPGEVTSSVDLGSTEFSTSNQAIVGVTKTESATIKSYSYSSSGGVLKFSWTVSATGTNPIPSVTAEYDTNVIVVTFESLTTDRVLSAVQGKTLSGGISLDATKSGNSSVYSFTGLTSQKPFKLSATTSPNQVILEIDL